MAYKAVWMLGLMIGPFIFLSDVLAEETATADSVRKYKFLAKTSREKKEYDEAIGYYKHLLKYSPADLKASFFLGDLFYRKRNFAEARVALRRAVALDSLHLNSNLRLYGVYQAVGETDSAALSLERVLLKKPNAADYRRKLADIYRREGQNSKAIVHYEHLVAATADTGLTDLFTMLAGLHEEMGQVEQALSWRRRLADRAKNGTGQIGHLESIVELQLQTADVTGAYASLLELARVDSQSAYAYYSRIATIAAEKNDDPMRFQGLKGMVEANPKDLESVAVLVQWHLSRDEVAVAKMQLKQGLQQDPSNGNLLLLNGDILLREGDEEGAIAAFETAKSNPVWEKVAQQRIWQLRPPETEEERLKREFFGGEEGQADQN
ncbi:MAG: tetratricopeptide repeat protein [Candidatus Latescibacterota bacterium]